jgi:hypothetical protein
MRLKLKLLLGLFTILLSLSATARADAVILTGGTVSIQVPPSQTSISVNRPGVFSLTYINPEHIGPLATTFSFQSITQGFGSVSLNGMTAQFFTGLVSFNDSSLTGNVTAFATFDDAHANNPLFTVNFIGDGFLVSTPSSHTFDVEAPEPVPEPVAVLLFGSGLAGLMTVVKRRRGSPTIL